MSMQPADLDPDPQEPAAAVRGLHVGLPSRDRPYAAPLEAVRGLGFTVPSGQVTALVGTNGAGKTTTLRALIGAVPFAAGSIDVLGTPLGPADVGAPAGVAVVPDAPAFPGHWTSHHVARLRRTVDPGFDVRRFRAYLTAHRIPLGRTVRELSGGELTQLAVGAALAQDPRLLILDEPLGRLDPLARTDLIDELRSVMAREGRSILLATHDLEGMDRFVDHLVVISRGQDLLEGDVEPLREEFLLLEQSDADAAHGSDPDGSPLIGATTVGGATRALVHVDDAAGLPPAADLRRPGVSDLVTHWLRAAATRTVAA